MDEKKAPRLLISFVLDNSPAMAGERLAELAGELRRLAQDTPADLEWELSSLDAFSPQVIKPFDQREVGRIRAGRFPLMGRAIDAARSRLLARAEELRRAGEEVYRPWLFILSGGMTLDDTEQTAALLEADERSGSLMYLPFLLSDIPLPERLLPLERNKHMIGIKEGGITGLFDFVVRLVTQRMGLPVGESVNISKSDFEGWAVL